VTKVFILIVDTGLLLFGIKMYRMNQGVSSSDSVQYRNVLPNHYLDVTTVSLNQKLQEVQRGFAVRPRARPAKRSATT